ncbi:MAG: alginate lyase family protein [bacterium]|nr:alginate lyase family protein [bacterium]
MSLLPAVKKPLRKAKQTFYAIFGTLKLRIYPKSLTDKQFFDNLIGFETLDDFIQHLQKRIEPKFFIDPAKKDGLIKVLNKEFRDAKHKIVAGADEICNHSFDLLGSGKTNLEREIKWHLDFKANRRWYLIHPRGIDVDELDKPSDIKVPWELSRCQYFVTLGKAYWLSKDEKYAREFKNETESWIENNPVGLGVNWLCTMEVAIRVANWLCGFYFFKDSSTIDNDFLIKFSKSLLLHGRHIRNNLEYGCITSNHYLSDIVGLLYLGILFPEFKESKGWKQFAIQELRNEMQKQVNPDGMDFEGSTCYHRLVLELFFFSTLLTVINDKSFNYDYEKTAREIFGDNYVNRLYKMFEFVLYTLKPNGVMPQIGDNDSGRLHILSEKEILDMRYLLNFGAIFFNEPKFKLKEFGFSEDALWIFGEKGYKRWKNLTSCSLNDMASKAFPDSGIYVMRDKKVFIIVHCASNGQNGNGGHNHNDVLSFELNWDGQNFIVDPGTYNYTGDCEMRNLFRSSAFHNTVVFDGEEINRFNKRKVFQMQDEANPKVLRWETDEDYDILEAEHYGYKRLKNPVIHNREIRYCKKEKKLKIRDRFKGKGEHKLQWNLVLSPEIEKDLNIHSKELKWRKEKAFYSLGYGMIRKTRKLTSKVETIIPYETEFEIYLV